MIGKIIKKESNNYIVKCADIVLKVPVRGKINFKNVNLLVGDTVEVDLENKIIIDFLERKNSLRRPKIANVDICIIVMSLKKPDFSSYLLDKNITFVLYNKINPIICFTKSDLLNEEDLEKIKIYKTYYENLGINVIFNYEIEKLKKIIKNKTVVLTGQTGAGKSTLLNKLDSNLKLKTSPISEALNRGVHTTKHVQLYEICDSLIADTPGFSSLDLLEMNKEDIKNTFREFKNINCVYKNCMHYKEDECLVKKEVKNKKILQSRYDNYIKFINEVK